MRRTLDDADYIWSKVYTEPNSGCWLWTGTVTSGQLGGYGVICSGSRRTKITRRLAHRVSYETFVGTIPDGMIICHRCDVTSCVNPDHLFAGTKKDNACDMVQKGRWKSGFRKGTASGLSRLTESQVEQVKAMVLDGKTQRVIANAFGVNQSTISLIASGKTWTHV